MRRSPRVMLAWVAAVVVMLATVRVVARRSRQRCTGARTAWVRDSQRGSSRPATSPLGATVTAGDLRTVRRPSTTVAADALRDPDRAPSVASSRSRCCATTSCARVISSRSRTGVDGIVARRPAGGARRSSKDGFQPPLGSVVDVLATLDPSVAAVAGSPGTRRDRRARRPRAGARGRRPTGDRAPVDDPTAPASRCSSPRPRRAIALRVRGRRSAR